MIKFNSAILLLICSIFLINIANATETQYTREYQIQIDSKYFENGRDEGISTYMNSFASNAGINLSKQLPNFYQSIREEITLQLDSCSPQGGFSERDYQWGDWNGLKIVQVKTSGALESSTEALNEPFSVSSSYSPSTISYIEYDIHPCEADWSSTSRIFLDSFPNVNTCSDLQKIFPDAVSSSSKTISRNSAGFTFSAFRNGTYLGGVINLDCTLSYNSLDDAINDINMGGGEFSFTIYAADQLNGEWNQDQTDEGIKIYENMLEELGSDPDYPCDPPVDISSFFDDNSNSQSSGGSSNNNSSNNNNNSSDSSLIIPSFFLLFLSLLF